MADATFVVELDAPGTGPRLAVKDILDVEGVPTTAGSLAWPAFRMPAPRDAACVATARACGARIVGKTNLHELANGGTGVNLAFGTPRNPLDPGLVPGGSSSGSAVAVAEGRADVALGTDTGGSVRIPAACCGVAGLKTTAGRLPVDGVVTLARSLDTVGLLAADVDGLVTGLALVEPGARVPAWTPGSVGRLRVRGVDPRVDAAVDTALAACGWDVVAVDLPSFVAAEQAALVVLLGESAREHPALVHDERVGADVAVRLRQGAAVTDEQLAAAYAVRTRWQAELAAVFSQVDVVALPTLLSFPPTLADPTAFVLSALTRPANLAGVPALALPVPAAAALPASVQLLAPHGADERLLAAGLLLEEAVA